MLGAWAKLRWGSPKSISEGSRAKVQKDPMLRWHYKKTNGDFKLISASNYLV